jgi:hypothetical protein
MVTWNMTQNEVYDVQSVVVWKRVRRTSWAPVSVPELLLDENERDEHVVKDHIAFRRYFQKGVL